MDRSTSKQALIELSGAMRDGNRRALSKAITLVENHRADQRALANELVSGILPWTGNAIRVGISGAPGVGKSTFIEALGLDLIGKGSKVAVLAVDPSSKLSGGSILGDRLRMERLGREPNAFIRPSPSAGSLGGVTRRTRETMLLCEAAGFDTVIIETVGVGQSEVTVSEMVDFFLVLLLPNAGDEIQGLKKGIVEMADALVINKADGALKQSAARARGHYENALHLVQPKWKSWQPPVLCASALNGTGIDEIWKTILAHRKLLEETGELTRLRNRQMRLWFQSSIQDELLDRLHQDPEIQAAMAELILAIDQRRKSPHQCAEEIVTRFLSKGSRG